MHTIAFPRIVVQQRYTAETIDQFGIQQRHTHAWLGGQFGL